MTTMTTLTNAKAVRLIEKLARCKDLIVWATSEPSEDSDKKSEAIDVVIEALGEVIKDLIQECYNEAADGDGR